MQSLSAAYNRCIIQIPLNNLDQNLKELLPKLTIFKSPFPSSAPAEIFGANKKDIIKLYNRSLLTRINPIEDVHIDEEDLLYTFHPAIRNFLEDITSRTFLTLEKAYAEKFSEYYLKFLIGTYNALGTEDYVLFLKRFNIMREANTRLTSFYLVSNF